MYELVMWGLILVTLVIWLSPDMRTALARRDPGKTVREGDRP